MEINFYFVESDYIDYLKQAEINKRGFTCVPNTEYTSRKKFLFGAVFEYNGINYFVPVSSKIKSGDNNIVMKSGKNNSIVLGTLRFAYMVPVPNKCLIKLKINDIPEESRRRKIRYELAFCRKNIHKIKLQAQKTFSAVNDSTNQKIRRNSCDFLLLQSAYITYCSEHNIGLEKSLMTDNKKNVYISRSIIKENAKIISRTQENQSQHNKDKSKGR